MRHMYCLAWNTKLQDISSTLIVSLNRDYAALSNSTMCLRCTICMFCLSAHVSLRTANVSRSPNCRCYYEWKHSSAQSFLPRSERKWPMMTYIVLGWASRQTCLVSLARDVYGRVDRICDVSTNSILRRNNIPSIVKPQYSYDSSAWTLKYVSKPVIYMIFLPGNSTDRIHIWYRDSSLCWFIRLPIIM